MTILPNNLLIFAIELKDDGDHDKETRYRTAISRAYYAAHLFSYQKLQSLGYKVQKEQMTCKICSSNIPCYIGQHQNVINSMKGKNFVFGDMLDRLREIRNDADYKLNSKIDIGKVNGAIKKSEMIAGYLQTLKKDI